MPCLREILETMALRIERSGTEVPVEILQDVEMTIRQQWPAQRVYISPPDSRKDPARSAAIRHAAKRLPVGIVAERHGIDRSWAYKIIKKPK